MLTLKTGEAAQLLNISPNTLRSWEHRFGVPRPMRSVSGHRTYAYGEVVALRDALQRGLSVASAVSVVLDRFSTGSGLLSNALNALDFESADRAMEAAVAMQSVPTAVCEVLLPALNAIREERGLDSFVWDICVQWCEHWIQRALWIVHDRYKSTFVAIVEPLGVHECAEIVHIRIFELLCAMAGMSTLRIGRNVVHDIDLALSRYELRAAVLAGPAASSWPGLITRAFSGAQIFTYSPIMAVRYVAGELLPNDPDTAVREVIQALSVRET